MKEIKLTSNTIKLEKGKKYFLVFDSAKVTEKTVYSIMKGLKRFGVKAMGILIEDATGLRVIEKEENGKKNIIRKQS